MDKDYKGYRCPICGCEFLIYTVTIQAGRYVTCPMDGRHLAKECDPYGGAEQCMGQRRYRRNAHGALEQDG